MQLSTLEDSVRSNERLIAWDCNARKMCSFRDVVLVQDLRSPDETAAMISFYIFQQTQLFSRSFISHFEREVSSHFDSLKTRNDKYWNI